MDKSCARSMVACDGSCKKLDSGFALNRTSAVNSRQLARTRRLPRPRRQSSRRFVAEG
jgi:hypothetical protein